MKRRLCTILMVVLLVLPAGSLGLAQEGTPPHQTCILTSFPQRPRRPSETSDVWVCLAAGLAPQVLEQGLQFRKAHLLARPRTLERRPPDPTLVFCCAPQPQQVRQVAGLLVPVRVSVCHRSPFVCYPPQYSRQV